jgi:hypothetical protein
MSRIKRQERPGRPGVQDAGGQWDVCKVDLADTIVALEHRSDVIRASCSVDTIAPNDKGQGWPDIQRVPRRCCISTDKLQIQVAR